MFFLPFSPQEVEKHYDSWLDDLRAGKAKEGAEWHLIGPMVRYLGVMPIFPTTPDEGFVAAYEPEVHQKQSEDGTVVESTRLAYAYTCVHLQPNGDCGIYARRPKMCRQYPYAEPCLYARCTSKEARAGRMGEPIFKPALTPSLPSERIEEAEEWR